MTRLLLFVALLIGSLGSAQAHKASDSFLRIGVDQSAIEVRWDIALRDLDFAIGLDSDADGAITWGEVRRAEAAISAHALSRLAIRGDAVDCPLLAVPGLQIAEHSDGRYAVLSLSGRCTAAPAQLEIDYRLLFDIDAQHRGLLNLAFGGSAQTAVFAPDRQRQTFTSGSPARVFRTYFSEGIWHVWKGADHMLFLAGLFLPAVLRRKKGGWEPAVSLPAALRETAALITAFTLAHALTLALAASGVFSPPSRLIESLVAASVLFAGLNNLLPMVQRRLWLLAGFFGLIHGAAIAGALAGTRPAGAGPGHGAAGIQCRRRAGAAGAGRRRRAAVLRWPQLGPLPQRSAGAGFADRRDRRAGLAAAAGAGSADSDAVLIRAAG
jgi:hypothetical protein